MMDGGACRITGPRTYSKQQLKKHGSEIGAYFNCSIRSPYFIFFVEINTPEINLFVEFLSCFFPSTRK